MSLVKLFLLFFLHFSSGNPVDVSFKNVTFQGYQMFTPRFKPTILFGNSLKDFIPNTQFDNIEFIDQNIPVLYKDAVANIDQLTELIMEFCNLREIRPEALKNLKYLSRLSFKTNKIETIENGVFNNLPVTTLDLSYNQINHIYPQAFDNMTELYYINLAYNLLSQWNPTWFKNTPNLSVLYFKNNFIEELLAHSFKNFKKHRYLSLDLIFTQNKISRIDPDAFVDLSRINLLSLSNNLLEEFDTNLLKNVAVTDLRLNNNSIKCFGDNLDELFKSPSNYVEYNPFDCKCLNKIKKWSAKNEKEVGVADTRCVEDVEEEGEEEGNSIIDIENVKEVAKDVYAIEWITLVLPKTKKHTDDAE